MPSLPTISKLLFAIGLISLAVLLCNWMGCFTSKAPTVATTVVFDSIPVTYSTTVSDSGASSVKKGGIDTLYVPVPIHHWDTLPATAADTAAIIKAWLSTATYYTQELRDSDVYIKIEDTIYQNTIAWRKVERKILRPTLNQTIINNPKPRVKILAGGQLALSHRALGLIPSLFVIDKECRAFSIGIDAIPAPNESRKIYVAFYYPIKK